MGEERIELPQRRASTYRSSNWAILPKWAERESNPLGAEATRFTVSPISLVVYLPIKRREQDSNLRTLKVNALAVRRDRPDSAIPS